MNLRGWLDLSPLGVEQSDLKRAVVFIIVCLLCGVLTVNFEVVPETSYQVGQVATRTVLAPKDFLFQDFAERARLQDVARRSTPPIFVYQPTLLEQLRSNVILAFSRVRSVPLDLDAAGREQQQRAVFIDALGVHLPESQLGPLLYAGFPSEAEELVLKLLNRGMRGFVIADREHLPEKPRSIEILELREGERVSQMFSTFESLHTPNEARNSVSLGVVEAQGIQEDWVATAGLISRSLVRPNLEYDALQSVERQNDEAAAVSMRATPVKRGMAVFHKGELVTDRQLQQYQVLKRSFGQQAVALKVLLTALFYALTFGVLAFFGVRHLRGLRLRLGQSTAVGVLLVLTAVFSRMTVYLGESLVLFSEGSVSAWATWFVVPVAGLSLLIRILMGESWAVLYTLGAMTICGLMMDFDLLHSVFFLISGLTGVSVLKRAQERIAVIRAGVVIALVNAVSVLLLHTLEFYLGDGGLGSVVGPRAAWSVFFSTTGTGLSILLVFGLIPLFESVGFVTDFRFLELASLNHPLLRQLMLRAPGTYHHSVIVGTLAEAACEEIGANALQARVSAYFHDIGKSLRPQYFVENQQGANKHDGLNPFSSAQIIISHVIEGGRLAKEHNLPKPIIDNIYQHHWTGLLAFFHRTAVAQSDNPHTVRESEFRYPGPKPMSREAGIIMLADKVEAATRTIKEPNETNLRAMIGKIVNSVMADRQFDQCPLTVQEISISVNTFVWVLLGIYHHRIEYAETLEISRSSGEVPVESSSSITLDFRSDEPDGPIGDSFDEEESDPHTDYEAIEFLPKGD